jgi:hypothetical protein
VINEDSVLEEAMDNLRHMLRSCGSKNS